MRRLSVLLCGLTLTVALVGCGKSTSTSSGSAGAPVTSATATSADAQACANAGSVHFAKTKFVLHAGLAFGAFHRYIYKPYRAGSFSAGTHGRVTALVKAGAAGLFAAHELDVAASDAAGDKLLCHLGTPFFAAKDAFASVAAKFKAGQFNPTDVTGLESQVGALQSQASSAGAAIKDRAVSL